MPDVFKNIADAAGSSSVRRGFADLFSASKAALDEIQASDRNEQRDDDGML